jgi:hypothetical protein
MKSTIIFIVALLMNMMAFPVGATERFVLYDDFQSEIIDLNKWFGAEMRDGAEVLLEFVREIQGKRLHMTNLTYGDTTSNKGFSRGYNTLRFTHESRITAMKAMVQVNNVEAKGCQANLTPSIASLRLMGSFFNTTARPTPSSQKNDVVAWIGIQRRSNSTDKPDVLEVNYWVAECTNRTCTSTTLLDKGFLGVITIGSIADLSIRWDQANHQFIFQLDLQSAVFFRYKVPDLSRAGLGFKKLDVAHFVANCMEEPRSKAFMDAYFHKVYVNEKRSP